MVAVLRHQHMRQQRRTGQSTFDGPRRRRSFDDALAVVAGKLGAHVADHLEGRRNALQLLADILAELA